MAVPVSFGKIPTQSLSAMQHDPKTQLERYQISLKNYKKALVRALGGDQSLLKEHDPLFRPILMVSVNMNMDLDLGFFPCSCSCNCLPYHYIREVVNMDME